MRLRGGSPTARFASTATRPSRRSSLRAANTAPLSDSTSAPPVLLSSTVRRTHCPSASAATLPPSPDTRAATSALRGRADLSSVAPPINIPKLTVVSPADTFLARLTATTTFPPPAFDWEFFNSSLHSIFGTPSSFQPPSIPVTPTFFRGLQDYIRGLSSDDGFLPGTWLPRLAQYCELEDNYSAATSPSAAPGSVLDRVRHNLIGARDRRCGELQPLTGYALPLVQPPPAQLEASAPAASVPLILDPSATTSTAASINVRATPPPPVRKGCGGRRGSSSVSLSLPASSPVLPGLTTSSSAPICSGTLTTSLNTASNAPPCATAAPTRRNPIGGRGRGGRRGSCPAPSCPPSEMEQPPVGLQHQPTVSASHNDASLGAPPYPILGDTNILASVDAGTVHEPAPHFAPSDPGPPFPPPLLLPLPLRSAPIERISAQPARPFRCPSCLSVYATQSLYIAHLRKRHSAAGSLSPFQLPILSAELCRCNRCQHICIGNGGLLHHQSRSSQCIALVDAPPPAPSRSSSLARHSMPAIPSPFNDDALLSLFSSGLFTVHHSWRDKLYSVTARLLTIINANLPSTAHAASLAFTILPGVLGAYHLYRKAPVTQLLSTFLANISSTSDEQFSSLILDAARELAPVLAAKRDRGRARSGSLSRAEAASLRLRIERLRRERRDGSAMQSAEQLQDLLDKEQLVEADILPLRSHYDVSTVRSILSVLCPPSSTADVLSDAQLQAISQSDPLQISSEHILRVLERLPDGAAAGASGWTFSAMKAIFLHDSAHAGQGSMLLSQFCNLMLSGKLISRLWLRSRSVLVPKKDGEPRPLGIGDAWYRLVGRASLAKVGQRIGASLHPHQLGIGFKNGCEVGGRTAQMAFDALENLVLIPLDNKNAFNTMPRGSICTGLQTHAPDLLRFFNYAYRDPSPLFFSGEWVADMATGCKQGDNFGSIFYAVGFHPHLLQINEAIQRHIQGSADGCSLTGGVTAFIDDTTIFVDARIANLVVADVTEIYAAARIELAVHKCRFLVPPGTILPPEGLRGFPSEHDGCIILGCPVGTPSYRKQAAHSIVHKACRSLPAVGTLHPWTSLALIRNCISARVGYIARVSELADNLNAFRQFDTLIDSAVQRAGSISEDEFSESGYGRVLRSLPTSLNGLGIPRYAGLAGETACLLSREHCYDYLETYFPVLLRSAFTNWPPIAIGALEDEWIYGPATDDSIAALRNTRLMDECEALFLASGETSILPCATNVSYPWQERRETRLSFRPSVVKGEPPVHARAIRRSIHLRRACDLVTILHSRGLKAQAIWCKSSQFKGSGRWLAGPGGLFYGRYSIRSPREYKMALRMRLLLPPASSLDVGASGPILCSCGELIDVLEKPFHCLDCPSSQFFFIHRHNAVLDALVDLLESTVQDHSVMLAVLPVEPLVLPPSDLRSNADIAADAQGRRDHFQFSGGRRSVQSYGNARAIERNSGSLRADACVVHLTGRQYIDVAIANPAAASYRPKTPLSNSAPHPPPGTSSAIEMRTYDKKCRYRSVLGDDVDSFLRFVAFVVEATGHLSPDALRLVTLACSETKNRTLRERFCTQVGGAIARYNAMAAQAWVQHLIHLSSTLAIGGG